MTKINKSKESKQSSSPRICIIGGGFSGITVAIQLKRKLGLESFTIYEKNSEFGGTWLVNVYPGARCDIGSNLYSWSFEPHVWSSVYAEQSEILDYIRSVAQKYDLFSHASFKTEVKNLCWIENTSQWEVDTSRNGECGIEMFDFVISGISRLCFPNIPEEFNNFKGPKFHSAQWDSSIELKDKIVGVIGSGASAIQIIPEIIQTVSKLHCFQRNPIWLLPKPFSNMKIPKWGQKLFAAFPWMTKPERWWTFLMVELCSRAARNEGCMANRVVKKICEFHRKKATRKRPEIRDLIKPSSNVYGCHVPITSGNYYKSLCNPKVEIHREKIMSVRENSLILENGEEHQLDVLILATGFKYETHLGSLKIVSENGKDVSKRLNEGSLNYYQGICAVGFKNMFFANGPYALEQSALFAMELQTKYFIKIIAHMKEFNYKTFCIKSEVAQTDTNKFQNRRDKMAWTQNECVNEHLKKGLRITAKLYPYSGFHLWKKLRKLDPDLYEFQ